MPETVTPPADSPAVLGSRESPEPHDTAAPVSLRSRIGAAMLAANVRYARIDRFENCGSSLWILQSKGSPSLYRFATDRCHDRLCPACQAARSATIQANLKDRLAGRDLRFLTLTLRADNQSLSHRLTRLYDAFKALRRRPLWKARCKGGLATVEFTYNAETANWNVHLHLLVEGRYIPLADLKADWLAVTGDSSHVDIQRPGAVFSVAKYVTKYVTKGVTECEILDDFSLRDVVKDLANHKLVVTFGSWRRWKLLAKPTLVGWRLVCHYNEVFASDRFTPLQRAAIVAARELHFRTADDYVFTLPTGPPEGD